MSNPTRIFLNNCLNFAQNLFGADCLLCGAYSGRENLCRECLAHLPYLPESKCSLCANPSTDPVCGACLAKPPRFARTLAVFSYDFPIDALIQSLKYRGNLALATTFAHRLIDASKGFPEPDLLMPVPMHPSRLRERGYNQAAEIAKIVSKKTGIAMVESRKTRDTPSQTSLPWDERERNVRGAFSCGMNLESKHVAIVDDVMTTGSTLNELARMLQGQKAGEVSAWVIARAVKSV